MQNKKITSHSYDAFKRIDDLAKAEFTMLTVLPLHSVFSFFFFSHFRPGQKKKKTFSKNVCSLVHSYGMSAYIKHTHTHTYAYKFYQPNIVFFVGSISLFSFSSVRYFPRQVPKELTFTRLTSPFCVVVLVRTHNIHTLHCHKRCVIFRMRDFEYYLY